VVSPIATHPGLTRGGPVGEPGGLGERGEPDVYYPTGVRNFARVMAREDLQGVANAMLARELGLKRVFVLYDRTDFWRREFGNPFLRTARRLGIRIAGTGGFSPEPGSKDRFADRVARSGAEGVFIAGAGSEGGAEVLKALRARLGSRIKIMTSDPFIPMPMLLEAAGPAARGLYVSATDVPPDTREQTPAGRRFARDFGTFQAPVFGVLPAAQATDLVLDAIARSDGTRASVLEELRGAQVKNGILGDFRIDRYGDITPARIAIFRVPARTPPSAAVFEFFRGTVLDRVISVPASLSG
jgi:branched-chain amino acid transport system substrate-binding protein